MGVLKNISGILRTRTIAHSAITLTGTVVNGILGVLFFIFLARTLGPQSFGIVSLSIILLTFVADIADFGINTGLINFVGRHSNSNYEEALKYLNLGLKLKLYIYIAVLITGIFFSPAIARYIFLKPELEHFFRLSFIGVGGAMLFSFSTNSLQALQKYKSWAILNIFSNALRLFLVFLLSAFLILDTNNALITYIVFPFFGFFISLFLLPKKFLNSKNENTVLKQFLDYNKWVAASILVAAISSRMDSFFVARLLSIEQTGYYSVGVQLSSILPQFTYAIAAVVAPKIASYKEKKDLVIYLKKLQMFTLGISAFGFILSPIIFFILPLVYGAEYTLSIWPLLLLFYAQLIFLLSIPSHQTIFYYFSNPKVFVVISTIILFILIAANLTLIPAFGIVGAAISVLIGSIINFMIPAIYIIKKLVRQ